MARISPPDSLWPDADGYSRNLCSVADVFTSMKVMYPYLRGDAQMTSALGGGEGVSQFLTKGREVAWIWY